MIRYVISFKHDEANYFLKPDLTDLTPENMIEQVKRDCIKNAPTYVKNGLQNCSFWLLGTFDDKVGVYDQTVTKELITQKEILNLVRQSLGGFENGNEVPTGA